MTMPPTGASSRFRTQSWGMLPNAVASPAEALDLIRQGEVFDLAILDVQMPEMDGVALGVALRRHPGCENLPIVMLTSVGWRSLDTEALQVAAVLTKPIKPSLLHDALIAALDPSRAPAKRQAPPTSGDTPMAERIPLRILLAEDNVVNQKVALRILEVFGYSADLAVNGVEALEALDRQSYDVVLMDMQMPEMDGLEATPPHLREVAQGAATPHHSHDGQRHGGRPRAVPGLRNGRLHRQARGASTR